MFDIDLYSQIDEASKYFRHSHSALLRLAFEAFDDGRMDKVKSILSSFPSKEFLLNELTEKLKGKSVYKTLKKIAEGKENSRTLTMKGLFSLGTHVIIESEKGKLEYEMLLPMIYNRLGELLFAANKQ